MPLRLLLIEDSEDDALLLVLELRKEGIDPDFTRVDTPQGLEAALDGNCWDAVIADYSMPSFTGMDALRIVQSKGVDLPFILVSGAIGEEQAVEAMKAGAHDYIAKGNLARLAPALERELEETNVRRERLQARAALQKAHDELENRVHDRTADLKNANAVLQAEIFERHQVQEERKLVEQTLRASQDKLNLALAASHMGVWEWNTQTNTFILSPESCKILGVESCNGELATLVNVLHPEDADRVTTATKQAMADKTDYIIEFRIIRPDGEVRWVYICGQLKYAGGDKPLQLIGIIQDITERKLAEKALIVSEERFQLAMRGANDGLWDWNMKADEIYYSPRWKSMLGYADEELENSFDTWKRLLHPEDLESAQARVRDFLEGRATNFEIEVRMRHKDGHYLDILSRGFPIYDDQGEAVRMVGTQVDITERKKLESQLRQAQKMEAVGQLAGGVAHDYNNILSAIFGYSHLILERENVGDTVKNYIEEIMVASNRAAELTRSLLAFSRKQQVTLAVIDLNALIKDNEQFLRRLIREDIELKINCTGEPFSVLADRGQIEQVIMNLVTNARDAMPNGGTLLIETLPAITLDRGFLETHGYGDSGTFNLISVSDSGEGMDKEMQLHIFEPFFTTKEQGKGTGLGLAMAYGIVKKHNGFITVYSEPGKGTTFKIYLPRLQAKAQVVKMEPVEAAPLRGGGETILVGEDDAALRRLSTRVLSHYGYRVIEAVDGQDAVDKFIEYGESIRLVILDAIMPKKNGRDACQEMRMVRPDLKTVFVSGYAKDIFTDGNVLDGNSIFIQKPVFPNVLVAQVRELLDKK